MIDMNDNRIYMECVPQPVKVRKYEVDIDGLKLLLKYSKKQSKLSTNQISDILDKPLTLVQHWFRYDKYFAIPDEDIWFQLKKLLNITTNVFDKSIIEFEYRDGVYEKSERCYYDFGIAPTITCDGEIKVITNGQNRKHNKKNNRNVGFKR